MEKVRGYDTASFRFAVSPLGRMRMLLRHTEARRRYSYVERGFYAAQIRKILQFFPRDQIHIIKSDSLRTQSELEIRRLLSFLGVDSARYPAKAFSQNRYIVPVDSRSIPNPSETVMRTLKKTYLSDIRTTMDITGLDLSEWLDLDYSEAEIGL